MAPRTVTRTVALGDDRAMTVDDAGDPGGVAVLYLHGTPDSRLARHPDDGLAAAAGVRLLALDRPGYGGSSPPPAPWSPGWPGDVAADVARLLDALGVERCAVLAWSGGALTALALAAGAPLPGDGGSAGDHSPTGAGPGASPLAGRVEACGIVAGVVPRQAYDDPQVRAAGMNRLGMIELADVVPPGELGPEVAPMLAPAPCDLALAAEHQAENRSAADTAELAAVAGGAERMAAALVEAVRPGLAGAVADVEAQARPLAVDLSTVAGPVHLWYGGRDLVAPPAFGRWYETHLPHASLTVDERAAHFLLFTRWSEILTTLTATVAPP